MNQFNIAELTTALLKRWKFILVFTIASVIIAAGVIFFITPKYTATTKLLPGNAVLADKARLFNDEIQHLYSFFGSGDDLDRLMSMASMDTSLKQVIHGFDLTRYYQIEDKDMGMRMYKSIRQFKKDLTLVKTVNNELEISYAHQSKDTAAAVVNFMTDQLAAKMKNIWKLQYEKIAQQLDSSIAAISNDYNNLSSNSSSNDAIAKTKMTALLSQLEQFNKMSIETKMAAATTPEALIVLEKASIPAKISWPQKAVVLPIAALLGLVFSVCLVLISAKPSRF
ncbi:Wzz/FepE/Etk N-terminal domain-containing protein [Sediminibacterium sp.]|uniref:Wzz/FepE/Etk N-terminal domain-containing protein n=1 Tax=Sediminibacterium sp. TaxID=1917865 RepID=UPI003F723346